MLRLHLNPAHSLGQQPAVTRAGWKMNGWVRTDLAILHTSPDEPRSVHFTILEGHRHSRRENWCRLQKWNLKLSEMEQLV